MANFDPTAVTTFIRQNPNSSAKAIADEFGYSQFHFSRLFKQQMGVSLREYLSAIKVERSTKALAQHHSVIDSQLEAGYESAGTFSNTFKRFAGISPKQHTTRIMTWVQQLSQLHKDSLSNNILYMPYHAAHHPQAHPLDIRIHARTCADSLLFLALFPQALPKGIPSLGICLPKQNHYAIHAIPDGTYFVMVVEVIRTKTPLRLFTLDTCKRDVIRTPVTFPLETSQQLSLTLREKQPHDPPINVHPLKLLFDIVNADL